MRSSLIPCLTVCACGVLLLAGCGGGGSDAGAIYTAGVPLTGSFGGTQAGNTARPASLALTASGGLLTLPCGETVQLDGPLTPDMSGKVSASGTDTPASGPPILPVGPPTRALPVALAGSVSGQTLTLTITNATTSSTLGTYVLVQGKPAPVFTGACPA